MIVTGSPGVARVNGEGHQRHDEQDQRHMDQATAEI